MFALILSLSGGIFMSHCSEHGHFSDVIPVKVNQVFDSCSDKDCLNNLTVSLSSCEIPNNTTMVKAKCVWVENSTLNVEPINFHKGFYTIDIAYKFGVELYCYEKSCEFPTRLTGHIYANKNCVLYGGEMNTVAYSSDNVHQGHTNKCCDIENNPIASVQMMNPIVLECHVSEGHKEHREDREKKSILVSLGMFSIVELIRPTTVLVPTYEYTVPHKTCYNETEKPCDVFDKIKFPAKEFMPVSIPIDDSCHHCKDSFRLREDTFRLREDSFRDREDSFRLREDSFRDREDSFRLREDSCHVCEDSCCLCDNSCHIDEES